MTWLLLNVMLITCRYYANNSGVVTCSYSLLIWHQVVEQTSAQACMCTCC